MEEGPETQSDFVRREMKETISVATENHKETKKTEESRLSEKIITV